MQDNRRKFTENEKMLLYSEVRGRCPICGDNLTHKKNGIIYKIFEVAHIYPANPRIEEVILLKNELLLSTDVNDLKNVIATCRKCHKKFDTPRTVEEYQKWYRVKRKLIQDAQTKSIYELFNVEDDIRTVLEKINNPITEKELVKLSYDSLRIDEKTNGTLPYIIKRTIKNDVVDYYDYIKALFIEIDNNIPYKFDTVASQIKVFYCKCMQTNQSQEYIYNVMVDWLDEKTGSYSKKACEIVVAYFIQDCEVFS
ncbi:ABC-three component system protein [Clostridium lacusfryxellense]|uniref:ABC-three component system protein n=1 Tax=Clostridium lacusfryxellense TaxID=205328 RepID=UPI001C0E03C5|nr:ABC-three component system protein [Clostridium lacusfryxellense]MBU3110829.1 HNH endonuclease [Clostridium lacusfryxellense]